MCLCVFLWACCPFSMCFTVSYESRLAYTIKAHPDASKQEPRLMLLQLFRGSCTKCRIPIVIVRIFIIIRGSCTKCRIPIVIVRFLLLLLLFYYYSSRKTQRAAQTVRPRNLKLCQWVDQKSRRTYQSLSQSAHRWRYSDHRRETTHNS